MAFIPYNFLQAQGRPDVTGKIHTAEVLPFLVILWALTKKFGIEGAAVAWVLRVCVDALALWWIAAIPIAAAIRSFPPIILLALSIVIARTVGTNLWPAMISATAMGLVSGTLAVYRSTDLRAHLELIARRWRARPT